MAKAAIQEVNLVVVIRRGMKHTNAGIAEKQSNLLYTYTQVVVDGGEKEAS